MKNSIQSIGRKLLSLLNQKPTLVFLFLFSLPLLTLAQLTGRVINERNDGIPFASIAIKNSSVGATADSAGRFTIAKEQKFPFVLVVTSTGFRPNELIVKNNNVKDVT